MSPRTIVITGGSRGWGKAIALRLSEPGSCVIVNYLKNAEAAEETAREVAALGAQPALIAADVGTEEGVRDLLERTQAVSDHVDVFVHNAFHITRASPLNTDAGEWERAMAVGPLGLMRCAQAFVPIMPDASSRIICTTSSATHRILNVKHGPLYFPMAAAKGALEVTIRYLAVELGARGITVNGVAAGWIAPEEGLGQSEEFLRRAAAKTPLGRMAAPREVADVVRFLGSAEAGWVTGQIIVADGGLVLI